MHLPNLYLLLPATLLSIIGLFIVYSISPNNYNSQLFIFIFGLLLFFLISQIDFNFFLVFSPYLLLFQIFLLILTLVFGKITRGSSRWISIGALNYQASEFIKPFLILTLAYFSPKFNLKKITGFVSFLAIFIFPAILIFLEPDLGSTLIILAVGLYLLLSSKVALRFLLVIFLFTLISIPVFYKTLKPYQINRIETFLNPKADPLGSSYNQIQAIIAAGSGQLFGKGLGKGTQSHLQFLPEKQTDFIFASLAEELGFIGSIIVLILYFIICSHLIYLSQKSTLIQDKLLFSGFFILFLLESAIHIGINIGIFPVKGIPLPFISVGGSSAIASWISLGLASSSSHQIKSKNTYFL